MLICIALLAAGLIGCLFLWVTGLRDIQAGRKKQAALEQEIARLREEISEVRQDVAETAEHISTVSMPVPAVPTRGGLNLSTRSQALRMARRGDTTQQIAAALGIPEKEADLLVKVQRMTPPAMEETPAPLPAYRPMSPELQALLDATEFNESKAAPDAAAAPEPETNAGADAPAEKPGLTALERLLAESAKKLDRAEAAAALRTTATTLENPEPRRADEMDE